MPGGSRGRGHFHVPNWAKIDNEKYWRDAYCGYASSMPEMMRLEAVLRNVLFRDSRILRRHDPFDEAKNLQGTGA